MIISKEIYLRLQYNAIAHYDAMMIWAWMQPGDDPVNATVMFHSLKEYWGSNFCCYCGYFPFNDLCEDEDENSCPLDSVIPEGKWDGSHSCCHYLWAIMNCATTWRDWIIAAQNVKQYICDHGA